MKFIFEDLGAIRQAVDFLVTGARTERGILARTLGRKVPSAATQGTISVAFHAIGIMPEEFRNYLVGTFFGMGAMQPDNGFAWDIYEHSSVWATARVLQGLLTIAPEALTGQDDYSRKVIAGFEWLEAQRNPDGGFAFQHGLESRVVYTTFVGQALLAGIDACADDPTLNELAEELKARLRRVLEYLASARLNGGALWPDGPGGEICAMSTLFALQLIRQSGEFASVFIKVSASDAVRTASLLRKPLLEGGPFYRFREESAVNWRFEEFVPGRLRVLGELYEVTDDVVQMHLSYLSNNMVMQHGYCGWGYPNSLDPVTWVTALGLDSIGWAVENYAALAKSARSTKFAGGEGLMVGSNKVFVVHGHDEGARESVARMLEKWGIQPVILHEQIDGGRTVIEKFESHADVGFAVVLLTPDDEGGKRGATSQARARQNVVLELGYFMGKLGRGRVVALRRGDVELPSDYAGILYVPFDDAGAWKTRLGRELAGAGYSVDLNRT